MLLNIPLAMWIGFLVFISLTITISLGVAVFKFQKNVFKYHKFFALLTGLLALVHVVLAILLWFFGIVL